MLVLLLLACIFQPILAEDKIELPVRAKNGIIIANFSVYNTAPGDWDSRKLSDMVGLFDVFAIEGVFRLSDLRSVGHSLANKHGRGWKFMYSHLLASATDSLAKYALFWNKEKVKLTGIMPTVPPELGNVYAQDPMCVSFKIDRKRFALLLSSFEENQAKAERDTVVMDMVLETVNWCRAFWNERDILAAGNFNSFRNVNYLKKMISTSGFKKVEMGGMDSGKGEDAFNHIYFSKSKFKENEFDVSPVKVFDAISFIYGDNSWENSKKFEKTFSKHLPVWIELKGIK